MKLAVVGAGWAGMAAAVTAADQGADVTVFEASRVLGGRARAVPLTRPDGRPLVLDNGQHILIGAYCKTLTLMQHVGVDLDAALQALPLGLPRPDGTGLQTPGWAAHWPAPLDTLAGIATARGWTWGDRLALLRAALRWRVQGFACHPGLTVAQLCEDLPPAVIDGLIEPLCVSALNIPGAQASAQVFLNVLRDALFGQGHASLRPAHLLLPRTDLSELMPQTAARWLQAQHPGRARICTGTRVRAITPVATGWALQTEQDGALTEATFHRVIWATPAGAAAQAVAQAAAAARACGQDTLATPLDTWGRSARSLAHTAIATVYLFAPGQALHAPLLALPVGPNAPAQFVFDRGQLQPQEASAQGVLAFVVSAATGSREALQAAVLRQAGEQLGLHDLQAIQTVVERRATFACTPGLQRPAMTVAAGLQAAGDYVDGPYPATLEGAVRSGIRAALA
ncbi:MAG: hydroxysqualene dehydroxylase HpnE [Hydrogenophaga sp.]